MIRSGIAIIALPLAITSGKPTIFGPGIKLGISVASLLSSGRPPNLQYIGKANAPARELIDHRQTFQRPTINRLIHDEVTKA